MVKSIFNEDYIERQIITEESVVGLNSDISPPNSKFASFDLKIEKNIYSIAAGDFPGFYGIKKAALAVNDSDDVNIWTSCDWLDKPTCIKLVQDLQNIVEQGYKLITWDGTKFDFNVLAHASGLHHECCELALNHIDMMLLVTFRKGYYLSLQKALDGAASSMTKKFTLSDINIIHKTHPNAPNSWSLGRREEVFEYLNENVIKPLELADFIIKNKKICWTNNKGRRMYVNIENLHTVRECFNIPEPDLSWMHIPPERGQFVSWIPEELLGVQ